MSHYITKYVHSNDEIKEGDRCFFEGKYLIVGEFTHDDTVCFVNEDIEQEIPEAAFRRTAKKVILFLCEDNIEIGDKVMEVHNHYKYREFVITLKYEDKNMNGDIVLMIGDDTEAVSYNCIFKPIAKVSKEVIWEIGDGERIDNINVELRGFGWGKDVGHWIEGREELGYECVALIKNPYCKHYH